MKGIAIEHMMAGSDSTPGSRTFAVVLDGTVDFLDIELLVPRSNNLGAPDRSWRAKLAGSLVACIVIAGLLAATWARPSGWPRTVAATERGLKRYIASVESKQANGSVSTSGDEQCRTTTPGDECHQLIAWYRKDIATHPQWYMGLTKESTPYAWQEWVHAQGKNICNQPCPPENDIAKYTGVASRASPGDIGKDGNPTDHIAEGERGEHAFTFVHNFVPAPAKTEPERFEKETTFMPTLETARATMEPTLTEEPLKNSEKTGWNGTVVEEHVTMRDVLMTSLDEETGSTTIDGGDSLVSEDECFDLEKLEGLCHNSVVGESCYASVDWAMKVGMIAHPDWYEGLSTFSSYAEVQAFLHSHHPKLSCCPLPCDPVRKNVSSVLEFAIGVDALVKETTGVKGKADIGSTQLAEPDVAELTEVSTPKVINNSATDDDDVQNGKKTSACHIVRQGEPCYDSVYWAMTTGILQHPDWYQTLNIALTAESTFEEFQKFLHYNRDVCPEPCECHTAKEGELCYDSVVWAREEGMKIHSDWYPGLSKSSSFEDFQTVLYNKYSSTTSCPLPCTPDPTATLAVTAETLRGVAPTLVT